MRPPARIPTILGVLILIFSLAATVFLFRSLRSYLTRAGADATPEEIKITNLADTSFTVSWITSGRVSGTVNFGETASLGTLAADDRDQISGSTSQYLTHHVTLRYLKTASRYYFKVISGEQTFDNNGQNFLVTTAPKITASPPPINPIYGTVQKADGTPASGAIVYLTMANATPISTLVKSSGNWLVTLNNVRAADLADFLTVSGREKMDIFVQAAAEGTAQLVTNSQATPPLPQITLGKTYDLSQAQPTSSPLATPAASPSAGFALPEVATPSPSLVNPATSAAVPSDRPVFTGTGIPGKTVTIKIESTTPVTGTTTVDQNGNWNWTPPAGLTPGEHTVTMTTTDSNGKLLAFSRTFTVLASGTQVTESATPPATIKPSPSPSPTLKPSPTATASTAPASGNLSPTIFLIVAGLSLIILGLGKLTLLKS